MKGVSNKVRELYADLAVDFREVAEHVMDATEEDTLLIELRNVDTGANVTITVSRGVSSDVIRAAIEDARPTKRREDRPNLN